MNKIIFLLILIVGNNRAIAQNSPTFRYQDNNDLGGRQHHYDSVKHRLYIEMNRFNFDSVGLIKLKHKCDTGKNRHKRIYYLDTTQFVPYRETGYFQLGQIGAYNIDSLNDYLYNQATVDVLQSFSLQNFASNNSLINVELASFLFGPIRLGFGGSFKTTKDRSKDDSIKTGIQKIVNNGGAINMNLLIPLMFTKSYNGQLHFGMFGQIYTGLTPGIDSSGQQNFYNNLLFTNSSGIMFHFDVASNDKRGRLFFEIPCTYNWGDQNTYLALGLSDYYLVQLQIGAVLGDLLSFRVTGPLYSTSSIVQKSTFALSLQFSPSQVSKAVSSK